MRPKPELYRSEYGTWFKDPLVVAAYPSRPSYAEAAIQFLSQLACDEPRRVLDVGCGTGDVARRLAPLVDAVDAVDQSEGMLSAGKSAPGGDAANLRWILSRVEDASLDPPYALITAGESLHWLDWDIVMPRFAEVLTPRGVLALVGRSFEGPPALRERMLPILQRHSVTVWQKYVDLIEELTTRGLFQKLGDQDCGTEPWRPTIEQYLDCRHSQRSFSRTHMGPVAAAAFDNDIRALLEDLCQRGTIDCEDGRLQLNATSRVIWGRPLGQTSADPR